MHESATSIHTVFGCRALDGAADCGTIGIADFGSCGVAEEVGDEGAGEKGIQIIRPAELRNIGESATRGHFQTELRLHASVGFAFFGLLAALSVGTMAIAQTADGIRGFESETGGGDLCVAGGLIDIGPVFLKLVARCWRSRLIEHAVHHPHPA